MENCSLCPRNCGINRYNGEMGFCRQTSSLKIARAALHDWEEPCISGIRGSGTVFFSGCTLQCTFCQNKEISQDGFGQHVSEERLCEIFLELQEKGAHNINLVTPSHFIPSIKNALLMAKKSGLRLPIICNCGGYESVEALKIWEGLIDIYLTDLKFFSPEISFKFCGRRDYFAVAEKALSEMYRQTKSFLFDAKGILKRGVIVRHLMLPGYLFDTKHILDFLEKHYKNKVYISLMNQYTPPRIPSKNAPSFGLSEEHYERMVDYLMEKGMERVYIQEGGTCDESFIPPFDLTGVSKEGILL